MPQSVTPSAQVSTRNTSAVLFFSLCTGVADGVLKVGLPMTGTQLTDSPLAISALSVTITLPFLLFSLHTGVLVDRFDRRRLLWLAGLARVVALGVLLTAAVLGALSLPLLYGAGITLGVADVVALTAVSALIPGAIPKARWEKVNSWVAAIETTCSQFLGPLLGGLIFAIGVSFFLGFTGVCVGLAVLSLLLLKGRFQATRHTDHTSPQTVHRQILEGVVYVWQERALKLMSVAVAVMCAAWGAWYALMPLIATQDMKLSPSEYGVLISALGAGGVLGAVSVGVLNRLFGRRWVMFTDLVGTMGIAVVPLLTIDIRLVAAAAFLGGLGSSLWSVNGRTLSQHLVSDDMRGRYSATARLIGWGPIPLGAAAAGLLAELLGLRWALAIFAVPVALLVVPFMRAMREVTLDGRAEAGESESPKTEHAPPKSETERLS